MKRRGLNYDFWTKSRAAVVAHLSFSVVIAFMAFSVLIGGYVRFDGVQGQYFVQAGAPEAVRVKPEVWWIALTLSVFALLALPIAAVSTVTVLLHKLCAEQSFEVSRDYRFWLWPLRVTIIGMLIACVVMKVAFRSSVCDWIQMQ